MTSTTPRTTTVRATNGADVRVTYTPNDGTVLFQWDGGRADFYAGDIPRPTGPTFGLWLDAGAGVAIGAVGLWDVRECAGLSEPPTLPESAHVDPLHDDEPTRECDKCGRGIREGYGTDDGGVFCSLPCAEFTQVEYNQLHDEYDNGDGPEPFVYWTAWEESDLPEAQAKPVTLSGWEVEETGGGMRVLMRPFGQYFAWMSDADGGCIPNAGSPALVCMYAAQDDMGEPLAYATFPTAAECAAWAAGYAARVVSADV
jgi:hypothetical protein